jgi:ribose/xylose/arabinose/galactoside ABC-type transport system permease subunit
MSLFKLRSNHNNIIITATISLLVLLYGSGSMLYTGFFAPQVFFNLFIDNAYLIIVATGMAFVIITGGIDLSVASVVALVGMISASLLAKGMDAYTVMLLGIVVGCLFGAGQGYLIARFGLHPWIVTLAGMFLGRGLCYLVSTENISITNEVFAGIASYKIYILGKSFVSLSVVIALLVVVIAIYIGKYTEFGRSVYALGGSERSAILMGLPVFKTTVLVYTLSGFCSGLAGLVFTFYTRSGFPLALMGMEMEAIAACVIGGILLTGGFGYLMGPMLGVMCTGTIITIINFEGTLNSWWTKITVGFLLFLFMAFQRIIVMRKERGTLSANNHPKIANYDAKL